MIIHAFNDMLGKGWDSGAQYSYCIQRAVAGDPQFWWVPEVLRKFPHPPDWEEHVRNPDGTYRSFPPAKGPGGSIAKGSKNFIRTLIRQGHIREAREVLNVLRLFENSV